MNKQIEKRCQDCFHYEVCRFVNALAVANVVNAENCRMFKDTEVYRKTKDIAREIFEDIEDVMKTWTIIPSSDYCGYGGYLEIDVDKTFAELKKKYESEGE